MSELEFKSGIYKITINDYYIYIGQSVDVKSRWNGHLNELKQNKHYNKKMQSVFNKYSDSIKFEIIEECDERELDDKEIFYIEQFNTFDTNHGLNMSIGGDNGRRKYKTREEVEVAALERQRKYYKTHKEEISEYNTQYYQNNKSRIKEYSKKYRYDNIEYCKQYSNRRRRQKGILSWKEKFEIRYNLSRPLTNEEWDIWINTKNKGKSYVIKYLKSLPNLTFTTPSKKQKGILSKKEKFEIRYSLSRSLTDEEWNIWCNTKYKSKCYAIKYLKTLPNLTFTIPSKKYQNNKEQNKQYRRQKGILSHFERRKLQFETRYNLSRPLTNEEWDIWRTDKSISGSHSKFYATRFLKSLPNITFTIPSKK